MTTENSLINFQERRDLGQVLNATFAFIRISFKYIFKDILLFGCPFFILSGVVLGALKTPFVGYADTSTRYLYLFFNFMAYMIGWTISYSLVANYVLSYKNNGTTDFNVKEVRLKSLRDSVKLFFALLIYVIVFMLGLVLLIIPGIYYSVANYLGCINIILDKDAGVMDTFGESRRLTSGNWWRSLGIGLIISLIAYVSTILFRLPELIYQAVVGFHYVRYGHIDSYGVPMIILTCIAQLSYCLTIPLTAVGSAVYYYSLKEERDQTGLLEKINELGGKEDISGANEGNS